MGALFSSVSVANCAEHGIPDYVKTASVLTDDSVRTLPMSSFADGAGRKLPLHTKAATWLSALTYFEPGGTSSSDVGRGILKAAEFHRIAGDVSGLRAFLAEKTEQARDRRTPDDFAIQVKSANINRIPIKTNDEVSAAPARLREELHCYPIEWRRDAALRIVKRAKQLGLPVDAALEKMAWLGTTTPDDLLVAIQARTIVAGEHKTKQALDSLSGLIGKMPRGRLITNRAALEKTAMALDLFDRLSGLRHDPEHLRVPEDVCFGVNMTKVAEEQSRYITLPTGARLRRDDVAKVKAASLLRFGEAFVDSIADLRGFVDPDKLVAVGKKN